MELTALATGLLDALEQFDSETLPLGLYASDDLVPSNNSRPKYQEWAGTICPFLATHGFSRANHHPLNRHASELHCSTPERGVIRIVLVKYSRIKVRKYGSSYHVDKHEDRSERWKETDLAGQIGRLWKQQEWPGSYSVTGQILLFVGFDKALRPLDHELNELKLATKWDQKSVHFETRTWQDRAERGFGVRLAAWAKTVDE